MAKAESKPIEKLTYEEAFSELEKIISLLEAGDQILDESMRLFERAQALVKYCAALLDKAELKVKELSGETLTDVSGSI